MATQQVAETCSRPCCLYYSKFTYLYLHLLVLFLVMYSVSDPVVPSEMAATTLVSIVHCVGWYCYAKRSYLTMDHLFGLPKPRLRGHRFRNDEEVEMAVCE